MRAVPVKKKGRSIEIPQSYYSIAPKLMPVHGMQVRDRPGNDMRAHGMTAHGMTVHGMKVHGSWRHRTPFFPLF